MSDELNFIIIIKYTLIYHGHINIYKYIMLYFENLYIYDRFQKVKRNIKRYVYG